MIRIVACFFILFTCGCGPSGPEQFAISGQVTYDGQPVDNGDIGFIPGDGSAAKTVGADLVDGRYEVPAYEGPQAGKYKVVIFAERPNGRRVQADEGSDEMIDQMEQYIPDQYNAKSTLSVEISSNREDLDFQLEKPKRGKRNRR